MIDNERTTGGKSRLLFLAAAVWLFYLIISAETPYGIDDWSWGTKAGLESLVTGNLNGRYVSNLLEVIVSRSPFLKVALIGTFCALLPILSSALLFRWRDTQRKTVAASAMNYGRESILILAAVLFLTLPVPVWSQTYGWIAGFSNFGFAGLMILLYQFLLLKILFTDESFSLQCRTAVFFFGICIQLVLENVTIYILLVTLFLFVRRSFAEKRIDCILLILLAGNFVGMIIMFSSSVYGQLLSTGHAIEGMRAVTFDLNAGLLSNLLVFSRRFVYFFPQGIWGNNWVICSMTSSLLCIRCARKKTWLTFVGAVLFACFAVIFLLVRFAGPIESWIPVWSDVLSQRLNLLFFWLVLLTVAVLWKDNRKTRTVLLFLWLSAPGIILPLTGSNLNAEATRCFLTSTVFLVEFCLVLVADEDMPGSPGIRKAAATAGAVVLLAVCVQRLIIYHGIAEVMRERAQLVQQAQRGETDSLEFPDFPHLEYLWVTEPVGRTQREYFRLFYQIPETTQMHFNTGEVNDDNQKMQK